MTLVVALVTTFVVAAIPCQGDSLVFAVFGDSHIKGEGTSEKVLRTLLQDMREQNVELILGAGNTVEAPRVWSTANENVYRQNWKRFWDVVRGVWWGHPNPPAIVLAPGCMEIHKNPRYQAVFREHRAWFPTNTRNSTLGLFQKPDYGNPLPLPPVSPDILLYTWFWWKQYHFIILDTEEAGRFGQYAERIAGWQEDWLRKHLSNQRRWTNASITFVVLHRPVFPEFLPTSSYDSERQALHQLFRNLKVACVFSGHEHIFKRQQRDGVQYITTGGGGGSLLRHPNSSYHYTLIKVRGQRFAAEARGLSQISAGSRQQKR